MPTHWTSEGLLLVGNLILFLHVAEVNNSINSKSNQMDD